MNTCKQARAVGYCRTSGEIQRDNTSIPNQRDSIEAFCERNQWELLRCHVDESRSGSRIEGRENFQRMLNDAANGEFEYIVVHDLTRFGRDGSDIITTARLLKQKYGIYVVDTKGAFDTRKMRNTLQNFVNAGVSEHERISIMERTIGGRVKKAKAGLPWCPLPPKGRAFRKTGKDDGEWYVTEEGKRLGTLLQRYADGESARKLAREFGFGSPQALMAVVRSSQLSGTYVAKFNSPDIDLKVEIPIPRIPEIISPELDRRVKARAAHNQTFNKVGLGKYRLSGFIRCGCCGKALTGGTTNRVRCYMHHAYGKREVECGYGSIRAELVESWALNFLYRFCMDEPTFVEAVRESLPSDQDRRSLDQQIHASTRTLAKIEERISRLAKGISEGVNPRLVIKEQDGLLEGQALALTQLQKLKAMRAEMPEANTIEREAMLARIFLANSLQSRAWPEISYDQTRRFLHFLFGDNPKRSGYGIFVHPDATGWRITFKGTIEFFHEVRGGRIMPRAHTIERSLINRQLLAVYRAEMSRVEATRKTTSDRANEQAGEAQEDLKGVTCDSCVRRSPACPWSGQLTWAG